MTAQGMDNASRATLRSSGYHEQEARRLRQRAVSNVKAFFSDHKLALSERARHTPVLSVSAKLAALLASRWHTRGVKRVFLCSSGRGLLVNTIPFQVKTEIGYDGVDCEGRRSMILQSLASSKRSTNFETAMVLSFA